MEPSAKIRFLLKDETSALVNRLVLDPRDDLALAQSPQLRSLPVAERSALLEQRALRRKAMSKQSGAEGLVFTALGLMQMTSEPLAKFKSRRLVDRGIANLADLCCGLGGDSMHLPESIRVTGLDRDPAVLLAYRHNVSRHRPVTAVLGDAALPPLRVQACLIDPARRAKAGGRNWDGRDLMPSLEALENLVRTQGEVGIKLGPGLNPPEAFEESEWEYLGYRDSCLELMIWTGGLGERGMVRASELPSGATLSASRDDRDQSFADFSEEAASEPGAYIYEPVKCVVRAHLHALLGQKHGLRLLDKRIAYLTGHSRIDDAMLKRYALIRELPADLSEIRAAMRAADVGQVTVKKRGVSLVPEQVCAKVKYAGGKESATLIFTRVGDSRKVYWVRPEGALASIGDAETGLADDELIADG